MQERADGSYCESIIAFINKIFLISLLSTFQAFFCNLRMGNTQKLIYCTLFIINLAFSSDRIFSNNSRPSIIASLE